MLAAYLPNEPTLNQAEIISTECYREWSGPVWHRFLIVLCRVPSGQRFWIRLDRRIKLKLTLMDLALARGAAPANDTVRMSVWETKFCVLTILARPPGVLINFRIRPA